jgi:cysteine-rich repeat protein
VFRYLLGLALIGACGFDVPEPTATCGDGLVSGDEECDDGDVEADVVCDATCRFTCGNGSLEPAVGEMCDPGIASGEGACPTSCDDGVACTTDILAGAPCSLQCINDPITGVADGDGCCPAGANAATDSDCAVNCGNGSVDPGELCDTGIASGPGACPTSCDDNMACTTDELIAAGTCAARCENTQIMTAIDGDGCCPASGNANTDDDCSPTCGNGVVESGELCDTGIASGPGACPTSCNDMMACTRDMLLSAGTCSATCSHTPITMPLPNDGCCPSGANPMTDSDCQPVCGNGVVEGSEQCDDGNTNNNDGCRNNCTRPPRAFRFGDLDLRDPHLFVPELTGNTCRDITDTTYLGYSYNGAIQRSLTSDLSPIDGYYDASPTLVFRPINQANNASTTLELNFARCSGSNPVNCSAGSAAAVTLTATSRTSGECLGILDGTVRPYAPAVTVAAGACFVSAPQSLTLTFAGVKWTLEQAQIAAVYSGSPATNLVNGVIRGYLTVAAADATTVPSTIPFLGGHRLSYALPGGDPAGSDDNCAAHDDRDPSGTANGWWVYFNFTAPRANWTSP